MKLATCLQKGIRRVLVKVGYCNAGSECGKVVVPLRHVCTSLGSEGVDLGGGDAIVETLDDFLSHWHRIYKLGVKTIAESADALCNVVELDFLLLAIPLDNVHRPGHGRVLAVCA